MAEEPVAVFDPGEWTFDTLLGLCAEDSVSRVSMKGRPVAITPYYACPFCLQFPDAMMTSLGLMVPEGALLRRVPASQTVLRSTLSIDLREVGRVPCKGTSWDHVLCDWSWQ